MNTRLRRSTRAIGAGGVYDHVFALCRLLGFRFAPRTLNLSRRKLHAFGASSRWPTLEPFLANRTDEPRIEADGFRALNQTLTAPNPNVLDLSP